MGSRKKRAFSKWDIVIADLNPVKGSEISKIRPCLIISPEPMNRFLNTVIIIPFTSSQTGYPFRIPSLLNRIQGELCIDHIKSIDATRITKRISKLPEHERQFVNLMLAEVFGEP